MHKAPVFAVALMLALVVLIAPAAAETIKIGGTHSAGEIETTCKSVGGKWSGVDKDLGSYSCRKGDNVVSCAPDGKCVGCTNGCTKDAAAGTSGKNTIGSVLSPSGKAPPLMPQSTTGQTAPPPAQHLTQSPGHAPMHQMTPQ